MALHITRQESLPENWGILMSTARGVCYPVSCLLWASFVILQRRQDGLGMQRKVTKEDSDGDSGCGKLRMQVV